MNDQLGSKPSPPTFASLPHVTVSATIFDKIKKEQSPPQPPATKKTLTELTEELVDYDENDDDLLDRY